MAGIAMAGSCEGKANSPKRKKMIIQQEKYDNLHQAGQSVEEGHQGLLAADVGVAQDDADDVGAQVAVATDEVRNRIRKDGHRQHEEGVEAGCSGAEVLHQPRGGHSYHGTYGRTVDYLREYHIYYAPAGHRPLDDGHHDDGQHVGAGVVATALDLEEGTEAASVELSTAPTRKPRAAGSLST